MKFAETLTGKWIIALLTAVSITAVGGIISGFTGIVDDSKKGREAYEQNCRDHPKYDSAGRSVYEWLDVVRMEYEQKTFRDSVRMAESIKALERLFDKKD